MRAGLTIYPLSALLAGLALAVPAHAQDGAPVAGAAGGAGDAPLAKPRTGGHGRLKVTPYIEAEQVLTSELSPGSETLTYTRVAAGVEFEEEPRVEEYGTVAVFRDPLGNRWDLIEPA